MPDSDGIRQNHQLKYEAPMPSPHSRTELPTCPKFTPFSPSEGEKRWPEIRLLYLRRISKQTYRLPHNLCSRKELSGDEIEQKRFYIKGKGYSVFLGQHMTKHSTWDKEGQKGQSPTAASCLFKCHVTFTDAMSCDGVEGSHFVLCRLSVPFYTISLHNSPILGHSWYSKR